MTAYKCTELVSGVYSVDPDDSIDKEMLFHKMEEIDSTISQIHQAVEAIEARERRRGDLEGMVYERLKRQQEVLSDLLARVNSV